MFKLFSRYWNVPAAISLGVESLLALGGFWLGVQLRFLGDSQPYSLEGLAARGATFVALTLLALYANGLYDLSSQLTLRRVGIALARSLGAASIALWSVYYVAPSLTAGRGVFAISIASTFLLLALWRVLLHGFLSRYLFRERILIVGADDAALEIAREALLRRHVGYEVLGFVADDPKLQGETILNPSVLGVTSDTCTLALANDATRVVVAQADRRGQMSLDALLDCKTHGIPVTGGTQYYESLTGKIMLEDLRLKSWLIFSDGFVVSRGDRIIKRTFDIVFSAIGLLLAMPIMMLVALAVRLDGPGPIFFSQTRVGRRNMPFKVWKFRSMIVDAEVGGKAQWAGERDPRITRVGAFMRRSRLDELPQLWNVLKGDMSLVGPRPERPPFVRELLNLNPIYGQRLSVRPGLTGWAQIRAPYAASFEESFEKLKYDLYYIKNLSILLDLSILASTARTVLFGTGAR